MVLSKDDLQEIKEVVSMTRLGQMIYDDGEKAGIKLGKEQGAEKMCLLTEILLREKNYEALERAAKDKDFRNQLMKQYKIDD